MAKGARSTVLKANKRTLKAKVFGPVEQDRTARLSAKLLELARQPKPTDMSEVKPAAEANTTKETEAMEVDSKKRPERQTRISKARQGSKRIVKSRKPKIEFTKAARRAGR